jgi:hypothetical protein
VSFSDRILESTRPELSAIRSLLREIPIVRVDNVTKYFFEAVGEKGYYGLEFPSLAPPWPRFFIETTHPDGVAHASSYEAWTDQSFRAWGHLFEVSEVSSQPDPMAFKPDVRWVVVATLVAELDKGDVLAPLVKWTFALRADGERSDFRVPGEEGWTSGTAEWASAEWERLGPFAEKEMFSVACANLLDAAFLAISMMHCKNVALAEVVPPAALSKARERRKGLPLLRYYELEIEPMKKVLRSEGRIAETGLNQALHICRGHFKDYRKSGLFGRHKGLYWWDQHARGDADFGVVVKDYSIASPAVQGAQR